MNTAKGEAYEVDPAKNPILLKQASTPSMIALRMQLQIGQPIKKIIKD